MSGSPINREGNLATVYDAAGNLTRLNVRRAGPCLPTGPPQALCDQRFAYEFQKVHPRNFSRRRSDFVVT